MTPILVSKTASAAFRTLQEAVLSVPDAPEEPVTVLMEPGVYEEKVFVRKENLEIRGADPDPSAVVLRYGDGAKKSRPDGSGEYGTFNTAVLFLAGKDITVRNITVENTAGPGYAAGQALALYAAADRCAFYNCRFLGYQDTVFTGGVNPARMKKLMLPDSFTDSQVKINYPLLRNYFKDCFISGDVDFIFGPNTAFFEDCEIFSRKRESEERAFITAASTPPEQEFGLVFARCRLTGDDAGGAAYLGRPWRDFAKTAFVNCYMGAHICPEGWHNWGKAKAEAVCAYVEYGNAGPGARTERRARFCRQLENPELEAYFGKENVLRGEDGWTP